MKLLIFILTSRICYIILRNTQGEEMARKKVDPEILKQKIKGAQKIMKLCGGTQNKMACMFNVKQQAAMWWLRRGIPVVYREKILSVFKNEITEEEIWPDVFPNKNNLIESVDK